MSSRALLLLVAVLVVADQIAKAAIRSTLGLYESMTVIPGFFDLTRVHNEGAAFGMLNAVHFQFKALLLALVATAALVGVAAYAVTLPVSQRLARLGLACIVAGAAGNLIDRVAFSYVVDFVDVYWRGWHFWAFNVADAAITIGVALMIVDLSDWDGIVYPELFSLGPVTVYTYGVLLAASYLLGLWLAMRRAKSRGLDSNRILDLGIYIIIAALVGAKLLLLVVDFQQFKQSPMELLSLARSGGVFYGGLILAVLVAFWYIHRHKLPFWTTCDVFAPGIALGHVTGRLGCLAAGCCYGKPTNLPWAIIFTNPAAATNVGTPLGVPLHPTQLYEAGAELLILILLLATERKGRRFPGRTFWAYMFLYAVSRFIIEFYRGDPRGMVFNTLSTSQFISVILAPLAILMLVWLAKMGPEPDSEMKTRRKAA